MTNEKSETLICFYCANPCEKLKNDTDICCFEQSLREGKKVSPCNVCKDTEDNVNSKLSKNITIQKMLEAYNSLIDGSIEEIKLRAESLKSKELKKKFYSDFIVRFLSSISEESQK